MTETINIDVGPFPLDAHTLGCDRDGIIGKQHGNVGITLHARSTTVKMTHSPSTMRYPHPPPKGHHAGSPPCSCYNQLPRHTMTLTPAPAGRLEESKSGPQKSPTFRLIRHGVPPLPIFIRSIPCTKINTGDGQANSDPLQRYAILATSIIVIMGPPDSLSGQSRMASITPYR